MKRPFAINARELELLGRCLRRPSRSIYGGASNVGQVVSAYIPPNPEQAEFSELERAGLVVWDAGFVITEAGKRALAGKQP